jgi:CheY-like chemotaxis protein
MTEVQAKNLELERHRERLEQTVKKRTAQLEEAMEGAKAANEAKSQFLANMSHELRTPMNAIIGYTEMLVEDAEDLGQDDFIPDLKKIHTAGKHLLALINDILDLSKIEAGKMELFCEDFEVASLLKEIASTVNSLVEKNNNQLKLEYEDGLGIMHSDLTKVRQCLFNLLSNACKFTENGTITLSAEPKEAGARSMIEFHVIDTGIGVPPEKLERLFEEFTQADASTTRKYGGTGLGLAITKKFCEMMGGTIRVTSKLGEGTTFIIDLPVKTVSEKETGEASPPSAEQLSEFEGLDKSHVLVIDDDPDARDLLRRTLEAKGHSVRLASEGREGIEMARQLRPGLITLDVMMPGMDGWAVLKELKADSELRDVPVVMVSLAENRELGYSLGAVEYLSKPVDRQALLKLVGQHVVLSESPQALVVEDDDVSRSLMTRALKDNGWEVEEAVNGKEALDVLASLRPDIILLDLMMPVMDGFEFLAELQKDSERKSTPVVVITAKDLSQEERDRLKGAVSQVLEKAAFDLDELVEQIQAASSRLANSGEDRSGAEG